MNLIDDFLESVSDEYGNKIDFSNIEVDGFSGIVSFGNYWADISITIDEFIINDSEINNAHKKMISAFAGYVQNKMKESREYFENNKIK